MCSCFSSFGIIPLLLSFVSAAGQRGSERDPQKKSTVIPTIALIPSWWWWSHSSIPLALFMSVACCCCCYQKNHREGEGENGKRESEGCQSLPDGKEREGEGRKEVKMERKGGCMQRFGAKPLQMSVVFYCIRDVACTCMCRDTWFLFFLWLNSWNSSNDSNSSNLNGLNSSNSSASKSSNSNGFE